LLPTFEKWPGKVQPGVSLCQDCAGLVPAQGRRIPNPHLRYRLLPDGSTPQWTYTGSPGARLVLLLICPPLSWVMLRQRLIVGRDGVIVVDNFRTRSFIWRDLSGFVARQCGQNFSVVLAPRSGPMMQFPKALGKGANSQRRENDVRLRASQLNEAFRFILSS
jgi:hypothetical protein